METLLHNNTIGRPAKVSKISGASVDFMNIVNTQRRAGRAPIYHKLKAPEHRVQAEARISSQCRAALRNSKVYFLFTLTVLFAKNVGQSVAG
jgi:hypothetical protein